MTVPPQRDSAGFAGTPHRPVTTPRRLSASRMFAAVASAGLTAGSAAAGLLVLGGLFADPAVASDDFPPAGMLLVLFGSVTAVWFLIVGVPVYYLLMRPRGWTRLRHGAGFGAILPSLCAIGGAATDAAAGHAYSWSLGTVGGFVLATVLLCAIGALSGAAFAEVALE